jgi:ectoine hydroxylase-related dioxygenase (phytanoyl-CoA dioxygenase family)
VPLKEDGLDYVSMPTNPGDAIFFNSYAPHRSGPNMTNKRRRVLYVTYNAASEGDHRREYYADKRLSYPPDIEREPNKKYVFRV